MLTIACEPATDITENNNGNGNGNGNENENVEKPSTNNGVIIITSDDEITVSNGSSMKYISYSLKNKVEGLSVKASADVEWIHSFNYSNAGRIGFTVEASNLFSERIGIITVTYGEDSATVTVIQTGKVHPQEIEISAAYLLGHYYGNYSNSSYCYYIALSDSNYGANNSLNTGGWRYFIDLYSSERPTDYNNIRIPNGTYTFDPKNNGRAGTFLESYSIYKEYSANGVETNQRIYADGTLTVTDDLVKLEVIFTDGTEMHVVTYSGDYTIIDYRSQSGGQQ